MGTPNILGNSSNGQPNVQTKTDIIYQSIRDEILDQKKCHFQIFSVAVAIASVILAYSLRDGDMKFALVASIGIPWL